MSSDAAKCPVCSALAIIQKFGPYFVECPNCGKFGINYYLVEDGELKVPSDNDRFKISCILSERKMRKIENLFIAISPERERSFSSGYILMTVADLLGEFPRTPMEYFNRALLNLEIIVGSPAGYIHPNQRIDRALFAQGEGTFAMLNQLIGAGYLSSDGPGNNPAITARGWERIGPILRGRISEVDFFGATVPLVPIREGRRG